MNTVSQTLASIYKEHRIALSLYAALWLWNFFLLLPFDKFNVSIAFVVAYPAAALVFSFLIQAYVRRRLYVAAVVYVLLYLLWLYAESTYGVFSVSRRTPPHALSSLLYITSLTVLFLSADFLLRLAAVRLPRKLFMFLTGALPIVALTAPLSYSVYTLSSGVALTCDGFVAIFVNNWQDISGYMNHSIHTDYVAVALSLLVLVGLAGAACPGPFFSIPPRRRTLFIIVIIFVGSAGYCLQNPMHSGLVGVVKQGLDYLASLEQRDPRLADVAATGGNNGLHVIVIGESQNRNHLGAYGYSRPTTPWLSSVQQQTQFIVLSHAYSCHTQTIPVLVQSFTDASQFNPIPFNRSISLLDVLNNAGYRTTWVSNQNKYGIYENPITTLASSAQRAYWANSAALLPSAHDETLLPPLRALLADASPKEVVFIHLMGSHLPYKDRYPNDRGLFSAPPPFPAAANNRPLAEHINHYDNSLVYTDQVLSQIFDIARNTGRLSTFTYFSDHGEAAVQQRGHEAALFTYDMARIPLFFWVSPRYAQAFPDLVFRLKGRKKTYFTNDMMYDTLLGIIGIATPSYKADQDLSSPSYSHTRDDLLIMNRLRVADDPEAQP